MAAWRPWVDLPRDLVAEIACHVTCPVDRVRAACAWARRTWLEGVQKDRRSLLLPWQLQPDEDVADLSPGTICTMSFFCIPCNHAHRVAVPDDMRGARFFGAYPGGWFFLAYDQHPGHRLINVGTHEILYLPNNILWESQGLTSERPMLICAATLSASPALHEGCVGTAIVYVLFGPIKHRGVTFWRMGSPVASPAFRWKAEDVIYHKGAFHFLIEEGDLYLCTPEFKNEAPLEQLQIRTEFREMEVGGCAEHIGHRYLVECRGELLMILRVRHPGVTTSFKVFRMDQEQIPDTDITFYCWSELRALDGRVLFVGHGCSRSFEAAACSRSEGVYFFDDRTFHSGNEIILYDGTLLYDCGDNGVWSGPPDFVRHLFPFQPPSNYWPPVWLLH